MGFHELVLCSDVTFAHDVILLNDSLVGMRGTKMYLVRAACFTVILKFHGLVPNTQFILPGMTRSLVENNRSTSHKCEALKERLLPVALQLFI